MSISLLRSESTLTNRYQTTIPEPVRKVLQLHKRDKISYDILDNGQVLLTHNKKEESDPMMDNFLTFLEQDISNHPEHIQGVSQHLLEETEKLTQGIDIDLNTSLLLEDD